MTLTSPPPVMGVVIPGYGHPQFLAEAVISACEQQLDCKHYVVVVDDGCQFPETERMVGQLMEKYPGVLHYLRQKNTRLPGARNTGVRFLLALEPDIDSIYFLDADNRIAPYSLRAFREALGDDPKVGWAYPDISMFGVSRAEDGFDTRETAPEYSVLKHLIGNISEAGSLVRADVFRSGVYYNEEMTSGFEDWDFWLGALGAGFVGRRARYSGFLYRRRPESMLADSRRLEETLIARIRETHKKLFSPKHLLLREQSEAPAFAVVLHGNSDVWLTSDPKLAPKRYSREEFQRLLHDWSHDAREVFFPQYLIYLSENDWRQFQQASTQVRWCFWKLREAGHPFAMVSLTASGDFKVGKKIGQEQADDTIAQWAILRADQLKGMTLASLDEGGDQVSSRLPKAEHVAIDVPCFDGGQPLVEPMAFDELQDGLVEFCEAMLPLEARSRHQSRKYAGPSCLEVRSDLINEICAVEERQPFPANNDHKRAAVFIAAELLFDKRAAERFADLLERLQRAGYETLVVLEVLPNQLLKNMHCAWWDFADDVVPMPLTGGSVEYRIYLGRRVSQKLGLIAKEDITVLARSAEILVSCGAAAGLEALGQAKAHGAKGYVWLDQAFMDADSHDMGQQAKLLAYEHAIHRVITNNEEYVHGLSAEGFPPSKFIKINDFWQIC